MLAINKGVGITVVANPHAAARRAVDIIVKTINVNDTLKTATKIGFATGATMVGVYAELVRRFKLGHVSFKNVIGVNLDEYMVDDNHPESYHTYMREHLYDHVDMNPDNIHIPNGSKGTGGVESCEQFNKILDDIGALDIQLLGIGRNAHIGFNEPPSSLTRTRVVELAPHTQLVNGAPSTHAITMGIADIMTARRIILIAVGEGKAITMVNFANSAANNPDIPASFIKSHPNTMVICDWDAVSKFDEIRKEASNMVSRGVFDMADKIHDGDSVMVWSPHPDDDVIGVGGYMWKYHGVHDISIVYQTTGRTAVSSSIVAYHREFLNTVFKTHSVSDATIGVAVRRIEAKTAAQICGITDVRFIEMPFYKRKSKDRRPPHVENNDVELVLAILDEKQPTHIIINGDSDPNHTHDLCKTAITRAVARAQSRPNVYEYCSAWGEFALSEVALVIPLTKHQLKMKKRAILAHESQNPPLVHSGDPTPFHTRAVDNARDTLALLKKMGFTYHEDVMGVEVLRAV